MQVFMNRNMNEVLHVSDYSTDRMDFFRKDFKKIYLYVHKMCFDSALGTDIPPIPDLGLFNLRVTKSIMGKRSLEVIPKRVDNAYENLGSLKKDLGRIYEKLYYFIHLAFTTQAPEGTVQGSTISKLSKNEDSLFLCLENSNNSGFLKNYHKVEVSIPLPIHVLTVSFN